MAGLEELRAQLKEAEAALAADPSDAELRVLTIELKTLIQSAADHDEGDDGSEDIFADEESVKRAPKRARSDESTKPAAPAAASPAPAVPLSSEVLESDEEGLALELEADELEVKVVGDDLPGPVSAFTEAGLHASILRNIETVAGYRRPTVVQKYSLPILLKRRDLLATAQTGKVTITSNSLQSTGSGKTGAFLIPIISLMLSTPPKKVKHYYKAHPSFVILVPTRELAVQIYDETRKFIHDTPLQSSVVYGGKVKEVEVSTDIIIATPGRLLDMVAKEKIALSAVVYLCFDEADRMLDMGFEKEIRKLMESMPKKEQRLTAMFSATFPKEVRTLALDFLARYAYLKIGLPVSGTQKRVCGGNAALGSKAPIQQIIRFVSDESSEGALVKELTALPERTLVFVERKKTAGDIAWILRKRGFKAEAIHGNRSQAEREKALLAFRSGEADVLVATSVAARGIHIDGVAHVINFELPSTIEEYIHRIGRTGRAGAVGVATSFFRPRNASMASKLIDVLSLTGQPIPNELLGYKQQQQHSQNV